MKVYSSLPIPLSLLLSLSLSVCLYLCFSVSLTLFLPLSCVCLCVCVLTGSYFVAQSALKLMWSTCFCLSNAGSKGMCHPCLLVKYCLLFFPIFHWSIWLLSDFEDISYILHLNSSDHIIYIPPSELCLVFHFLTAFSIIQLCTCVACVWCQAHECPGLCDHGRIEARGHQVPLSTVLFFIPLSRGLSLN